MQNRPQVVSASRQTLPRKHYKTQTYLKVHTYVVLKLGHYMDCTVGWSILQLGQKGCSNNITTTFLSQLS